MSTDPKYSLFYDWIRKNDGHIHPHVKIENRGERGLFASDSIECHAALVTIPWSLVVNRQHGDVSSIEAETERIALLVFLVREHHKRDSSFWSQWLNLLNVENEANELLATKMQLFDCIQHSTLGAALTARYQQLQEEHLQLTQSATIEASLELYAAVDHLVWSRVLGLPEDEPLSLVPLIDFANHSLEPSARWFIDNERKNIILRSERPLASGEEITISYGSKSNEELLYLYGFALPINPNDRVTLPVSLSPDDSLLEEKLQLVQQLNLPPRITLNIDGHLTDESKQLAKILSGSSFVSIDGNGRDEVPYLRGIFDEYLVQLNLCSDGESLFVNYYLDSQKSIIGKAIEALK